MSQNEEIVIIPYTHHAKYYETDQMGVIHHSNYIRWMEEARIDYLSQLSWPYKRFEDEGIISPVLSVSCEYKVSAHFDDIVEIAVSLIEYSGIRMSIEYTMTNKANGVLLAKGISRHCFLNKEGRPIPLKREFPAFNSLLEKILVK